MNASQTLCLTFIGAFYKYKNLNKEIFNLSSVFEDMYDVGVCVYHRTHIRIIEHSI